MLFEDMERIVKCDICGGDFVTLIVHHAKNNTCYYCTIELEELPERCFNVDEDEDTED